MIDDKTKTVCFSGHRKFFDPIAEIEAKLEAEIRKCIESGMERFITGGALGFDTLAAQTTIRLRREFPQIRLFLALPCPSEDQTRYWKPTEKAEYKEILELADEVKVLAKSYTDDCMFDRNKYMVNNSCKIIHYLRHNGRSGTKQTVNYAQKQGIELIGI